MIKNLFKYAALALMLSVNNTANACEQHRAALKSTLEHTINEYKKNHSFNAIYAITQDGHDITKGANGYFNIEAKKPLTPDIKMAIASGTKQMTAAAILKLQEKGKLNVKDVVSKHLTKNSYYFAGPMPEWASKITIHQLLTHTSGLPEYIPSLKLDMTKTHKEINKSIVEFATKQPLNFTPGKEFSYSNTGYVLLGLIIEEVSKKDLISFFKEELFNPLGMKNTELATLAHALDFQLGKLKEFPNRYFAIPTGAEPKYMPVDNSIILAPFTDGGVTSTLEDLNIWNNALHNGKVLKPESYKLMTTPYAKTPAHAGYESHVGYGIYIVTPPQGEPFYMHGGNAIGIRGEYIYLPAKKMSISIISNVYVYEPKELQGKIDYSLPANQIDIKFFMDALLKAVYQ